MRVHVARIPEIPFRREAMSILNDMRLKGQLCDVVLCTKDGGRFQVHRSIMATCSSYFRALFTSGFSSTERFEVEIPGVTSNMMFLIVTYAYTRQTLVTEANVIELLPAADQFNIMGMVADCCRYLITNMTVDNCIGIWRLAEAYNCASLAQSALSFLLSHFVEIAPASQELMELPLDMLIKALQSDELNVSKEYIVWNVIVRWVDRNPRERSKHYPELLKCVRLGLLSIDEFVSIIKKHPFLVGDETCWSIVSTTMKIVSGAQLQYKYLENQHTYLKNFAFPRIPYSILFCIGGWSGDGPTKVIEVYDSKADAWTTCLEEDPAGPRAYHKCAVIGQKIYVVGGTDGNDCLNSCKYLDARIKKWKEVSPMYSKRCYLSLTVLDHIIYAIGGYDGIQRLETAEKYDYNTNQWTKISPMRYQRSDASAAVVQGFIYVAGGFNGTEYLNSVEYYDKTFDIWTAITPMNSRRSGVSCIAYRNCLYAAGGFNGIYRLETAERYDPQKKRWSYIKDMYKKRSNFAIEVIGGIIYVSGGFNGTSTVNDAECYDVFNDEWRCLTPMTTMRSALAACVVSGLPNVRDYVTAERAKKNKTSYPPPQTKFSFSSHAL